MKILKSALVVLAVVTITACGSSERKKNRAEAAYAEEKTKTMQDYKSCVAKAKEDQAKLDACERIIKANQVQ